METQDVSVKNFKNRKQEPNRIPYPKKKKKTNQLAQKNGTLF